MTINDEQRYWIALNMISNLVPSKFRILLDHFSSPREIWEAPRETLAQIPGFEGSVETFCRHRAEVDVDRELGEIVQRGLSVLTLADEGYPQALRSITAPPPVLYLQGDYREKDQLAIAMVGTRRPSAYGRLIAEKLAKELGERGFTIVSGLALGIDTAAHRAALSCKARTLGILGSGFGQPYPRENVKLMKTIAQSGGIFSEFPINTLPDRWTFPRRNRIISGLSRGTVVVEAPERSGALITAKLALEQGREVFAVPGPITGETSQGTHRLIQQGAKLITSVDDILEEFGDLQLTLQPKSPRRTETPALSPLEAQVLKVLAYEPIHFNDIVERAALTPTDASYALFGLTGKDLVKELDGKRYAKLP
jgi:DNA processing protein